jgi:predicted ATPase
MIAIATEIEYPYGLARAAHLSAWLYQLCRDGTNAYRQAITGLRITSEIQSTFFLNQAIVDEGWAWVDQGKIEAGIARMQEGMENFRQTNFSMAQGYFSTLLATGYVALGDSQAGLAVIANALALVERNDDRWFEAEAYRLKGELLLIDDERDEEAEACFWRAIEVARGQQAKSWELRATMSLCRLWQAEGKLAQAREMLAAIYNWFSEGFGTPDLVDARALLAELA